MFADTPNDEELASVFAQIEEVRAQIADVLLECDRIKLHANPQIEADYMLKIGVWENRQMEAALELRRARRRCQLAQARVNAGQRVVAAECEQILSEELAMWEARYQTALNEYTETVKRFTNSRVLAPYEAEELKRLYRALIGRLHPDLHPGLPERYQEMFYSAQAGYETGNLILLQSLDVATKDLEQSADQFCSTVAEAWAELEMIRAYLAVAAERLEGLESVPPYSLKERLETPDFVCAKCYEAKQEIERLHAQTAEYNRRFEELKRECS